MQLEIDILKATINVKKRPRHRSEYSHQRREDSDNRCLEKQILTAIITKITIIKNDYYYQKQKEDKYTLLRVRVIELFTENKSRYGYRRIHALLKRENIIVSEKVIRRIMKEEQLVVKIKRTRKYNSY